MAAGFLGQYSTGGIPGVQIPSVNDGGQAFQAIFNSSGAQSGFAAPKKEEKTRSDIDKILEAQEKNRLREEGLLLRMLSPEFQRQQLENKLAFDRKQMAQAAPYKFAFGLPGQIMEAYTRPATIALAGKMKLAEGITGGANIMANAASNIPNLTNYQRSAQGFAPKSYF